ncbi:hypothetical protein G4228_015099, partial [Cervus hanglu yarkandensis]
PAPTLCRRSHSGIGSTVPQFQVLTMLRNRRTSYQELCDHEDFLIKLCGELIKTIQDTEDSAALKVRMLLQQQDVYMTITDVLEYSNKKKLHQMKCELQEWEEKEESKIHNLEQQVEQLDAQIEKVREQVSFVSTYKDHEYPIKLVQAANLVRQLQQVKDSQLFIDRFEEEIPRLRAEMEQLEAQIWEPREIVFADVLLRRSK